MNREIFYDDDEPQCRGRQRESLRDDEYWQHLWSNILRAALIAVVGVLVREVVTTIEGRHRTYDPYGV